MILEAILIASAFYLGQLTAPEKVEIQTVPIKVGVPMPCDAAMPDRPVMPLESLQGRPPVDVWVDQARAELKLREGYEIRLQATLQGCIGPP